MPSRKPRTPHTLHNPQGRIPIAVLRLVRVCRVADAHVAVRLLHDDAEDDALLDAELGGLGDGDVEAADVVWIVAVVAHGVFIGVEEGGEVFPRVLGAR